MKLYAVIDKTGTGYVTADKDMARYALNGRPPTPYCGVCPQAHALREMVEDGDIDGLEMIEFEHP